MRAQAADEPLDEDLEYRSSDERVEEAKDRVVEVPKTANTNLHEEKHDHGDQTGKYGGSPDRHDFMAERVRIICVGDIAVVVVHGE